MDNGVNKPETNEDNQDLLNDLNKSEQQIKDSEGKTFIDWTNYTPTTLRTPRVAPLLGSSNKGIVAYSYFKCFNCYFLITTL